MHSWQMNEWDIVTLLQQQQQQLHQKKGGRENQTVISTALKVAALSLLKR